MNYVAGIRHWHIINSLPWLANEIELHSLYRGAMYMQPKPKPKRKPVLVHDINQIMMKMDLANPLHAAVFACLTTTFFSCARLGEFTVINIRSFSKKHHITIENVKIKNDFRQRPTVSLFLPCTKTSSSGEEVFFKQQQYQCDPQTALANHININKPKTSEHLFSYSMNNKRRPLTRSTFLIVIKKFASEAGIEFHFGHSLRIGGTLEYLLRGVPFEIVKRQGRWKSEAFTNYLRNHAEIIGPYLEHCPNIQNKFLQFTN